MWLDYRVLPLFKFWSFFTKRFFQINYFLSVAFRIKVLAAHSRSHPSNPTKHRAIWPSSRCRWFLWTYSWYFTLWTFEIVSLFIASNNTMKKWLCFVPGEKHFASDFLALSLSAWGTLFPIFWIFSVVFKHMETAFRITFNCSTSCCCFWASSSFNNDC